MLERSEGALGAEKTHDVEGESVSAGIVGEFLLGGRTLERSAVVHLLLSSSFGINALFYASWLGYHIGIWALVIQASWAASFFLLSRFSAKFVEIRSLHDFLGVTFGKRTRVLAAWCSLVGIVYFVGWEVGIGESAIESFVIEALAYPPSEAAELADLFVLGVSCLHASLYKHVGPSW